MVGFYRYLLATLVVWSHLTPFWLFGIVVNPGVYAVFCFYIVSGYFAGMIFDRFCGASFQPLRFYLDRALRIMPAFLVVIAVVIAIGHWHHEPTLGATPEQYRDHSAWLKAIIMPLNKIAGMFGVDLPYGPFFAVTPVASLAVEMQFFFVFPVFAMVRTRWILAAILASTLWLVHIALGQPGQIEAYTYRNLSGLLPLFLSGYLLYRHRRDGLASVVIWIGPAIAAVLATSVILVSAANPRWLGEMSVALATCPFVLRLALSIRSRPADRLAGYVAYGVFLTHIPIIRIMHLGHTVIDLLIAMGIATFVAVGIHILVEAPVLTLRHWTPLPTPSAANEILSPTPQE